jgi:hypothetical protein
MRVTTEWSPSLTDHMAREAEMARPERFELPTTWFEEVEVENQSNRNSKLDGPPSPNLPPSAAGNRDLPSKPYIFSQ